MVHVFAKEVWCIADVSTFIIKLEIDKAALNYPPTYSPVHIDLTKT